MKRSVVILILFLGLFEFARAGAQTQAKDVVLVAFEGTVEVFVDNSGIKPKDGLKIKDSAIIRAKGGTALLFFPSENLYGVVHESTIPASKCLKRSIPEENLKRIKAKTSGILDVFLESDLPVSATKQDPDTTVAPVNINLILIMDASTSMRHEFSEVQDYIYSLIMQKHLKTGDYLALFIFGADTRKILSIDLELPRDEEKVRQAIYSVKASQLATDIGAMLSELQDFVRSEKFPNKKTVIIWATDGKNDPPDSSPWLGKEIYDPKAFDAYKLLKSEEYKVLLLSIGADTAARSLSDPLGGEVIEVARDVKAQAIGDLLESFIDSIELITPASIGRIGRLDPEIKVAFLSTYGETKTVKVEHIAVSVDGGEKTEIVPAETQVSVDAYDQAVVTYRITLPTGLTEGDHVMEFELVTEGNNVMKSVQQILFVYSPFNFLLAGIIAGGAAVLVLVIVLVKRRSAKK